MVDFYGIHVGTYTSPNWYIYLHDMVDFCGIHVGTYTSAMDGMGKVLAGTRLHLA